MNDVQLTEMNCSVCNTQVKPYHRYCNNCGNNLYFNKNQTNLYNDTNFQSALIFFIIYLLICLTVHFTNLFNDYSRQFRIEILLAAFTLIYVQQNFNSIKPLLRFRNFSVIRLIGFVTTAAISSVIINIIVAKLNVSFFETNTGYYNRYRIYSMPALLMVYSIAINPALFEELAFRGVLYNYLSKFLNERFVVIITAFMFAVVHLNLLSLTWLIPFGIVVGNMRKKFGTIWYGVIFHFTFNLVTVLFDLHENGYFR